MGNLRVAAILLLLIPVAMWMIRPMGITRWTDRFVVLFDLYALETNLLLITLDRLHWLIANVDGVREAVRPQSAEFATQLGAWSGPSYFEYVRNTPFNQMFLCRAVDRFQLLFVEFAAAVFEANPKLIPPIAKKSGKAPPQPACVSGAGAPAPTQDPLERARKLLRDQSFENTRALIRKLGVSIDIPAEVEARVRLAVALRHLIVHNWGRADAVHLKAFPDCPVAVGQPLPISGDSAADMIRALLQTASAFQSALGKKFPEAEPTGGPLTKRD